MKKIANKHSALTAFFTMLPMWIVAILCSIIMCDCNSDAAHTPRQKAYPRIATHDSTFVTIASCPLHFEINKVAQITLDSTLTNNAQGGNPQWINIFYKSYNATIHCTFTPATPISIASIISNRQERMALNAGNHTSELIELTNANDFHSQLLITKQSQVTPIQFISTNNRNWVVSGAVYFNNNSGHNLDSISPIFNVLKRDLIHSLKTIDN